MNQTDTNRLYQARAEARRETAQQDVKGTAYAFQMGYEQGHEAGVAWADDNPKPRTITEQELAEIAHQAYIEGGGTYEVGLAVALHLGATVKNAEEAEKEEPSNVNIWETEETPPTLTDEDFQEAYKSYVKNGGDNYMAFRSYWVETLSGDAQNT